jgi:hypothetical protein
MLLLLLAVITTTTFASHVFLSVSIDWQLGVRCGIEYRFHPSLGVRFDSGVALYGLVLADAFFLLYLLPEDSPFECNILAGIPNAGVPFTFNASMVSFGLSLMVRYWWNEVFGIDLRVGAGFPLFFEKGKEIIRDVMFPLELWPDLVLGITFRFQ